MWNCFFFKKTNDLIKLRLDALKKYIHVVLLDTFLL